MIKLLILLSLFNWKLESKAEKHLTKYYDKEVFIIENIKFNKGKLYNVDGSTDFVYIGTSKSKFEDFEFMVLFDESKTIKLVKVLVYRENYGGEFGSKRWLKQFIGLNKPKYMVDAISGATISVHSIKMSINNLIKELQL